MASAGMSSTVKSGRFTSRPRISGDALVISARTASTIGMRFRVIWPSWATTTSLSPRRRREAASWENRMLAFQRVANRSDAMNAATWSSTKPSTAPDSGRARSRPSSGSTSSKNARGSMSNMICSVRRRESASCTAGSSTTGPTRDTNRSVSRKFRRAHTPVTAASKEMQASTTSSAAPQRRRRARPVPWWRSDSTSEASASRSARKRSTSSGSVGSTFVTVTSSGQHRPASDATTSPRPGESPPAYHVARDDSSPSGDAAGTGPGVSSQGPGPAGPEEATMGLFGRDKDEKPKALRFKMKERLISIGDDYWIEGPDGDKAYKVNGKALRVRDTWTLEDRSGREVAKIRERKLSIRDAVTIELGGQEATVKKAMIGLRDRYKVEVDGGPDLKVHGNIVDHEYEIEVDDGPKVGEVSKKWFRVRDSYGVDVLDPAYTVLVLAVTVAVDALSHD
jgi:uncharacterized protein YxjI